MRRAWREEVGDVWDCDLEHPGITRTLRTGYPFPEPRPIGLCVVCGEPVYAGEPYIDCDGDYVHTDCAAVGDPVRRAAWTVWRRQKKVRRPRPTGEQRRA